MCGNCCTGGPGYVRFTLPEAHAMAAELGLSTDQFLRDYTHTVLGQPSLNERPSPHGQDCILLDRHSSPGRALCRVYRSRPQQCRTWPFWAENLRSPKHWTRAARTCPGMNHGELHPPGFIALRLAEDLGAARLG